MMQPIELEKMVNYKYRRTKEGTMETVDVIFFHTENFAEVTIKFEEKYYIENERSIRSAMREENFNVLDVIDSIELEDKSTFDITK